MTSIQTTLRTLAEPSYAAFQKKLLPGLTVPLLGVRLPVLRKLARNVSLSELTDDSFEERMLQGILIGSMSAPVETILQQTEIFLNKIDNWSVCDSFCSGLKIAKTHPETMWQFLVPYLQDSRPYAVRFAIVMMLFYYINDAYFDAVIALLVSLQHPHYYVRMAIAWALSLCYVFRPAQTLAAMQTMQDDAVYNKAIQKICESHQVTAAQKDAVKQKKRCAGALKFYQST